MQSLDVIYLAAPFGQKLEMREKRDFLVSIGHTVNSRWVDEDIFSSDTAPSNTGEAPSPEYLRTFAEIDYEDAASCNTFIVFPGLGAGHHTEMGIALRQGSRIIVIGKKNNIFHYLPHVEHFASWEDFLSELGASDGNSAAS